MSKFFITNNSKIFRDIKDLVEESAYRVSFEYNKEELGVLTTQKLTFENQNGAKCDCGFALVTGTMIWDEGNAIDADTLQKIHTSFTGDVNSIRKRALGNYAVAVLKENSLYVFGEIPGFYNIYYYHVGKDWLLSNSLYDMAMVLHENLTLNKLALIEASVQDGNLLSDTLYNEVGRLSGFNFLKITKETFEIVEEEHLYSLAKGTLDEKVKRYTDISVSNARKIADAYGIPAVSMTGGLDARMVMSSFLAADVRPHLYYGTGNSLLTNTFQEDKNIDKIFSQKFGLTFYDRSWATPDPMDKYWDKYLKLYGFCYSVYAGSDAVIESIKDIPCKLFTYGYCGELLRNLPWIEARKKDYFTLDEYIDEFYVPKSVKDKIVQPEEYVNFIRNKQLRICKYYHLDPNHIANEDIFYLSLERRKSSDAKMLNFINFVKCCCLPLGQYEGIVSGRVTCKEAEDSKFMLHCLHSLRPEVLDVPVFSHCTMREFYRETMSLTPQNNMNNAKEIKATRKNKIKTILKTNMPFLVKLKRMLIKPKSAWRHPKDEHICNYIQFLFSKYDTYDIINSRKFEDIRRLNKYVMMIYAVKKIKEFAKNSR